jgi:Fe-S cluster assembly iron-binding protein IscA
MIDKNSIQSFLEKDIHNIFISFIQSGCAGTKISVETEFDSVGLVSSPIVDGLIAFYRQEEQEVLESGHITFVKGKWLFSSEKVQDRCGCGSSFSFEKKLIDTNKLTKLQGLFGKDKK